MKGQKPKMMKHMDEKQDKALFKKMAKKEKNMKNNKKC